LGPGEYLNRPARLTGQKEIVMQKLLALLLALLPACGAPENTVMVWYDRGLEAFADEAWTGLDHVNRATSGASGFRPGVPATHDIYVTTSDRHRSEEGWQATSKIFEDGTSKVYLFIDRIAPGNLSGVMIHEAFHVITRHGKHFDGITNGYIPPSDVPNCLTYHDAALFCAYLGCDAVATCEEEP
jgi:hypothetical protein